MQVKTNWVDDLLKNTLCIKCKKEPIRNNMDLPPYILNSYFFEMNLRGLCKECFDIEIKPMYKEFLKLKAKSLGE
tara:strand:+ start:2043 stop:2267 length:225 start_codon:yes stop_codon:yes gene_type:complete